MTGDYWNKEDAEQSNSIKKKKKQKQKPRSVMDWGSEWMNRVERMVEKRKYLKWPQGFENSKDNAVPAIHLLTQLAVLCT